MATTERSLGWATGVASTDGATTYDSARMSAFERAGLGTGVLLTGSYLAMSGATTTTVLYAVRRLAQRLHQPTQPGAVVEVLVDDAVAEKAQSPGEVQPALVLGFGVGIARGGGVEQAAETIAARDHGLAHDGRARAAATHHGTGTVSHHGGSSPHHRDSTMPST